MGRGSIRNDLNRNYQSICSVTSRPAEATAGQFQCVNSGPRIISAIHRCEAIDCVVFDLSVAGAGIKAPNATRIPDEFDPSFDCARTLRPCRLAWRSESAMGVAFIEAEG